MDLMKALKKNAVYLEDDRFDFLTGYLSKSSRWRAGNKRCSTAPPPYWFSQFRILAFL
ncbi:MAG: hypothetical protein VB084_09265 [Syntrophomonadaceae bacterium]|nr:hypothetical protein [Syntrophomonadaceae bacterium]